MSPARRRSRERAILEILDETRIGTQAELVAALRRRGFTVTQATVSRDIQRLGVVKRRGVNGRARYALPETTSAAPATRRLLETALREFATGIATGDALLAIRTQSGCANAVAVAIDEAELDGVAATLAGDDTIFVLARTADDRARVLAELEGLVEL